MNFLFPTAYPVPVVQEETKTPIRRNVKKERRAEKAARMPVICTKCKELKPSTEFSFQSTPSSGGHYALKSWCRICCTKVAEEHRVKRLEAKRKAKKDLEWNRALEHAAQIAYDLGSSDVYLALRKEIIE